MSRLSVVVPVYKVDEKLFRGLVDSLIAQKTASFDLEIILVDDGCPENSSLFDEYAKVLEDGLVMKVLHRENGGPGAARNTGLTAVTGDYLAFADADDRVLPGIYEKAVSILDDEKSTDCVVCSFVSVTSRGPVTHIVTEGVAGGGRGLSQIRLPASKVFQIICGDNFRCGGGYLWTKIFRVDSLRANNSGRLPLFDEELFAYEDKLWCLRALTGLAGVRLLPDTGYAYKNDAPSISNGEQAESRRRLNVYLAFDRMEELAAEHGNNAVLALRVHDFKIVFTDLLKLRKGSDPQVKAAAQERMKRLVSVLSPSDFKRARDRAAYRYMKLKYGR